MIRSECARSLLGFLLRLQIVPRSVCSPDTPIRSSPMIEVLAHLQQLRQQLREAVAKLTEEAERDPGYAVALSCVHLATECQKLERLIGLLSDDVFKDQRPETKRACRATLIF